MICKRELSDRKHAQWSSSEIRVIFLTTTLFLKETALGCHVHRKKKRFPIILFATERHKCLICDVQSLKITIIILMLLLFTWRIVHTVCFLICSTLETLPNKLMRPTCSVCCSLNHVCLFYITVTHFKLLERKRAPLAISFDSSGHVISRDTACLLFG